MDYLYGKLNELVELQKYKFISSDGTVKVVQKDNTVDFSARTDALVTLKQVQKDGSTLDDQIKYYALYAYNEYTKKYDIKLGDEIVVDTSIANDLPQTEKVWIKVGETQVVDEFGNPLFYDDGSPVVRPVLKEVVASATGQLVIDQIPASAIVDYEVLQLADGEIEKRQINSTIDGNGGGEVY